MLRLLAPRGTGDVLLLPDLDAPAPDEWVGVLRRFLSGLGYRAHVWRDERHPSRSPDCDSLARRVLLLVEASGCVPSLIACGTSALVAIELAVSRPDLLACLVLVAPSHPRARRPGHAEADALLERLAPGLPVTWIVPESARLARLEARIGMGVPGQRMRLAGRAGHRALGVGSSGEQAVQLEAAVLLAIARVLAAASDRPS